jgi:hypothetical protein
VSIRETHRNPRDRWPLEFDLGGVPRDAQTRERLLEELRGEPDPEIPMDVPQVKNSFASDFLATLTPAQKQSLQKALLAESTAGGKEFDLSKPPVDPYQYHEYPKCMYSPDGKVIVNARDREHEQDLLKKKYTAKPPKAKKEEDDDKGQVA